MRRDSIYIIIIPRGSISFEALSDTDSDRNLRDDKTNSSLADTLASGNTTAGYSRAAGKDDNRENIITVINEKDTLKTFIERSPLAVQFATIVLFYMASDSYHKHNSNKSLDQAELHADANMVLTSFSFTSKEFFDAYSQLALDTGLIKYLARHLAFSEFMLTLEYLAIVREDASTARYQFQLSFEDLRWIASTALQQIIGGQSLSSPQVFYPSSRTDSLPAGTYKPVNTVNPVNFANTDKTAALLKDLSQSIFSSKEIELNRGDGTSRSPDDMVRPRSTDYGLHRPYFQHRVPPTTYSFRKPDNEEWKRIIAEFFDGPRCITCGAEVLPDYFDIWIGEPLDDSATSSSKSNQRMTEVLGDINNAIRTTSGINTDDHHSATIQGQQKEEQLFVTSPGYRSTDRELLTYNYGVIPMDGRDAFIAFAKPKRPCPNCGTNPFDSVSIMPKY
jgi:hypothetical protein